jgi:transposase InsO family protein
VAEKTTCRFLGITPRTIQNWRSKGLQDKRKGCSRPTSKRALSPEEWDALYAVVTSKRFADFTPEQIVATLAQEGTYIASVSSMYRLLRRRDALAHRSESRKPQAVRESAELEVTGPNQVWSWDITWLKTPVRGMFLYAYTIIDLFDRSIVGWCIETHESDELSMLLFARVTRDMKVIPAIVHADNGHPMRGMTLAVFLDSLMISRSYSRPRCSNDNAFIESWHKTLKYSVGYPKMFENLEVARTWYADFVHWYNNYHQHSGLAYATPMQTRKGETKHLFCKRNETIREARERNPLRWSTERTRAYALPTVKTTYRPLKKVV